MPNISSFKSKEERNVWYRKYRAKNLEWFRKYNREWMREYRAGRRTKKKIWAEEVMENPKEWDESQVLKAKEILNNT